MSATTPISCDVFIAGGGLSGLTLATLLAEHPAFQHLRIVVADRDAKRRNDRTWCFWATDTEPLPPVVSRRWNHCRFYSNWLDKKLDIRPYRYHMVRGLDFYQWAHGVLDQNPHVQRLQAQIEKIDGENGRVHTDRGTFSAGYIFNSAFLPKPLLAEENSGFFPSPFSDMDKKARQAGRHYLLQHFEGWTVRTENPVFDPQTVTFMDFRPDQEGDTRFVYVLPFSETEALVEYTVFSENLLAPEAYGDRLRHYLASHFDTGGYTVREVERGVIPMTDVPLDPGPSGALWHIGTAGGFVKASSGYAFKRTQRRLRAFVADWAANGRASPAPLRSSGRFRWYDRVLLSVLENRTAPGAEVFSRLLDRLPAPLVLRFLDEDTSLFQDLRLMAAAPIRAFAAAAFRLPFGRF